MPWSNQAMHHDCKACALEPRSNYGSPHTLEPVLRNQRSHGNEKPKHCN